ncbi:hypothetical protein Catovirus_1_26 [Catovirus CTV1]|uniref:C2H2-type domain-containing protein n=1 Tax=Catovirus CTV1 TaxID=1977631 RepID=A0A1V0S8F5_9VIRU|nr:hypothetical protein Catovirus_1_26 [Catovirus CTV1]
MVKLITCSDCGKKFNRKSNYEKHIHKKNSCCEKNDNNVIAEQYNIIKNSNEVDILKEQLKSIQNEKIQLEKRLEEQNNLYENYIQLLSKDLENLKTRLDKELNKNKGNTINNTINIINYIVDNHNNIPKVLNNCSHTIISKE